MRLAVEQAHLQAGLQAVQRAVATRTTLPVLAGVHLEADREGLTLTGTDLELTVRSRVPATVEEPGRAVLPARYLSEFARRVPFGAIRIAVDPASHAATLVWERSEHTIHGLPPEDYPDVRIALGDGARTVDAAALRRALRQTAYAVTTDESKPALTGVLLRWRADGLLAIGCDGFRVAMVRSPAPAPGEPLDLVIPGRAAAELQRLLADAGEVRLEVQERQLQVEVGTTALATRLIDAAYPDVPQLLPREYPVRLQLERAALLEAAERIAPLADARQTARWLVVLETEPERLVVRTHDPEVGQAYEEVAAALDGEPLRIGLNVRYLLDALRHLEGETLELGMIDPTRPIRIRAAEDPDSEHVVFPIRL